MRRRLPDVFNECEPLEYNSVLSLADGLPEAGTRPTYQSFPEAPCEALKSILAKPLEAASNNNWETYPLSPLTKAKRVNSLFEKLALLTV